MRWICWAGWLLPLAATAVGQVPRQVDPKTDVVVIANKKSAASLDIARHYCKLRRVPTAQLLELSTTTLERIDRKAFEREVLGPVRRFLADRPKVRFLVTTYGVPLRIPEADRSNDKRGRQLEVSTYDSASVDSELALARVGNPSLGGPVISKYYLKRRAIAVEDRLLIVGRLDGPTPALARDLVGKALQAESFGTSGSSYVDTRGARKPQGWGARDLEMARLPALFRKHGLTVVHDAERTVLDLSKQQGKPLFYWGWGAQAMFPRGNPADEAARKKKYSGKPPKDPRERRLWQRERKQWLASRRRRGGFARSFQFADGAVAVHVTVNGAAFVRSADQGWAGPLLSCGATATMGTIWDTNQQLGFPEGKLFFERFLSGYTLGESARMACKTLSWQLVLIGDPLYAPFAAGIKEKQAANRRQAVALWAAAQQARGRGDRPALARALVALDRLGAIREPYEQVTPWLEQLEKEADAAWKELSASLPSRPRRPDLDRMIAFTRAWPELVATGAALARIAALRDAADLKARTTWEVARLMEKQKRWARALDRYRFVRRSWPLSRYADQAAARIAAIGKNPAAAGALERSATEDAARRLWNLGKSMQANGQAAQARKYFKQLLAKYPESSYAAKAKLELGSDD